MYIAQCTYTHTICQVSVIPVVHIYFHEHDLYSVLLIVVNGIIKDRLPLCQEASFALNVIPLEVDIHDCAITGECYWLSWCCYRPVRATEFPSNGSTNFPIIRCIGKFHIVIFALAI